MTQQQNAAIAALQQEKTEELLFTAVSNAGSQQVLAIRHQPSAISWFPKPEGNLSFLDVYGYGKEKRYSLMVSA